MTFQSGLESDKPVTKNQITGQKIRLLINIAVTMLSNVLDLQDSYTSFKSTGQPSQWFVLNFS